MRHFKWLPLFATLAITIPAFATVLVSNKNTQPPDPDESPWIFEEIGDDAGTSGTCTDAEDDGIFETCTLFASGESDRVEGAMLYQVVPAGQDAQIVACFDSFTGVTNDFTAVGVGIGQNADPLFNWSRTIKHVIGRISGKRRPVGGGTVFVVQGNDTTDTELCWAAVYDHSLQESRSYVSNHPTGDPTAPDWRIIQVHDDVQVTGDYRQYLYGLSNDNAELLQIDLAYVQATNEITIVPDSVPSEQCSDGVNNDFAEDGLIDYPLDPGCTSATDDSELGNPFVLRQCNNGLDDETIPDGLIDYPADNGCTSADDDSEDGSPPTPKQCSNGVNDDGDAFTDYPADPGCTGPTDDSENSESDPCNATPLPDECKPPAGTDLDDTFSGEWFPATRNVFGWYFAYPDSADPAETGGVFTGNNNIPDDYEGRRLKDLDFDWKDIEPNDDQWTFGPMVNDINSVIAQGFDGAMINLRGLVTKRKNYTNSSCSAGESINTTTQRTAPDWLTQLGIPEIEEGCADQQSSAFKITQLKMDNATLQAEYKEMVQAFGDAATGTRIVGGNPIGGLANVEAAIIHAAGSSAGEEFTGNQKNEAGIDAWACTGKPGVPAGHNNCILAYWRDYGYAVTPGIDTHRWKIGLVTDDPDNMFQMWVYEEGVGFKGYNIEYPVGGAPDGKEEFRFGLSYDANGYTIINPNHPAAFGRHYQTQNENYRGTETGLGAPCCGLPGDVRPQRYRESTFRALSMFFTLLWAESIGSGGETDWINEELLNWAGMQLGHQVNTTDVAWVQLMRTWRWNNAGNVAAPVSNFERWAYQREVNGATTPTLQEEWGFNAAKNKKMPDNKKNIDLARKGDSIGITVDNNFLGDNDQDVAIVVTYLDSSNDAWSVRYTRPNGTLTNVVVDENGAAPGQPAATNKVRSQVVCLDDFRVTDAPGLASDFTLESPSGETEFMMVQVWKTDFGCN